MAKRIKVGVIGASGYTGVELVRLLSGHEGVEMVALCADRNAGQPIHALYPQLHGMRLPDLTRADDVDWSQVDVVFGGLPHGASQQVLAALPEHLRIVDLSADFRLRDVETYAQWYGHPHQAVGLQAGAVYGLVEWYREQVAGARLVANPGCYPTASLLPLIPLLRAGLVKRNGIIIDAKSGVSGAGRSAKEANLYTEVAESIHAYGIGTHRHTPEIEQELSVAAGQTVEVVFTPHLVPMSRGILATIYVKLDGADLGQVRETLLRAYPGDGFVQVLPEGAVPMTRAVRGSNYVQMGGYASRRKGEAILVCAIDNLVKGASGQAVQNMNVMFGLPEMQGLRQLAMMP